MKISFYRFGGSGPPTGYGKGGVPADPGDGRDRMPDAIGVPVRKRFVMNLPSTARYRGTDRNTHGLAHAEPSVLRLSLPAGAGSLLLRSTISS